MGNSIAWLLESMAQFDFWPNSIAALSLAADGIIAATFLAVPVVLLYLYKRRGAGSKREAALVKLFLFFVLAVGLLHLASLFGSWLPDRGLEGLLKGAAALLALSTVIGFCCVVPHLLRVPSRDSLQMEAATHLKTLEELKATRQTLEERIEQRTKELAEAKQRFEIALRGSPISMFSQDKELRFTWAHNLPEGLSPEGIIGKTDADILVPEAAQAIMAVKRQAMEAGTSQGLEIEIEIGQRERAFYFVIEPLHDEANEVVGAASVAVDISERKASEQHLRAVLRELTHRSKNLLAVINAIARQTAARTTTVDEFLDRFGARLYAIGMSHDLLVADDWQGASLRMLVKQQLESHMDTHERIAIEGEDVVLKPEAVHNLGLAFHELTANAEKFGSLSNSEGAIRIQWNICEDAKTLRLIWEESGGPEVHEPSRSGFGRTMLERVVGKALAGDVSLTFPSKGVHCEIVIPDAHISSRG